MIRNITRSVSALIAALGIGFTQFSLAQADIIVNIKGYGDGAGANIYSYPQPPGAIVSLFNPVLVDLKAGQYLVSDAWGLPGALYDTWNFQTSAFGSWASHYVAAETLSNGQYRLLLDAGGKVDPSCANHFCAWSSEALASNAFLATPPVTLTLTQDTKLAFASADYYLPDNAGGISLLIHTVPEPGAWQMLLVALPLGMARRLRQRARHS